MRSATGGKRGDGESEGEKFRGFLLLFWGGDFWFLGLPTTSSRPFLMFSLSPRRGCA